ncbi:hypothetical protein MNB_SV-13-2184 [hydrothermal vent metagenome]|uniref:Uncharacterized protein n=1 Tax=hydrothermal vent metagenome TaxID=652676 RepID=A0A1W1CZR5_9ZZZZ
MFKGLKRRIKKMFREFLVYHHSSMEYRAKILTLMISSNHEIYGEDTERAEVLIDTVYEYHSKIITNNGLNFEHLIQLVQRDTKEVPRYVQKIDIGLLRQLHECITDEDEALFQERIIEFLETLKEEYQAQKV